MIPLTHFLIVSACIFCIGLYTVLSKKNAIMILVGIELMINAAILNFVAFGRYDKISYGGQIFGLFAIVLAAAAVAVGLALVLNVYRHYKTINPDEINELKDK
ncbi:NADH-quinone oxidoreductase subunit NuoK [Sphingobacterium thalpophilum]|uniref:NADH-quinone oxidoreductase subunit K n=1 Tax=Sphingobacterium thalpophilum TaxID=259 RepID=A0A4U9VBB9_9SPHI|nr:MULTISPECIES: NADH-quinone oxidoreductase subunit NuoK [Sphingobacterium]MCW8312107.1 NADH-quinone oxidoreductase subunit NuoK [Sphingobacterium sp. InxBP1]VTR40131.1 NADH-quinone oxidoreductase subunit K [Sphingobacterium thalpophilum]